MRSYFYTIIFLLGTYLSPAQVQEEINPPSNIKSIIFKGQTDDQFPIVLLGDPIYLEFDDLFANEEDYYFKIIHCNYDWTPSALLKSEYLNGMDNQRITDYNNSYSTLQPYSNYKLSIPNEHLSLKVSGNYLIAIYNNYDELQFSRRFIVYQDLVSVQSEVKRSRDFNYLNEKQNVQFSINASDISLVNPKKEVKVAILQNYQWSTAKYNLTPQFILGNTLSYKYDKETSFFGGNEYLNFDTKDLRAPSAAISKVALNDLYEHYLFPNEYRHKHPYTYFPDINGDFVIRTLQGENNSTEAEYSFIHFYLPYSKELGLNNVYVYGKYNNYALNEENKMTYNEDSGYMEATIKMKQGFYNYKYVVENEDGDIELNTVSGNFHFTENNYLILVYYRKFGDIYDSIIGIGSANSTSLTN
ncbi:protein of unknown function [Arenibacter nanhaiticus]|uniref:Type 9 secretion system plug protein N-terminal domain-containing protein n=1 Tax=Arenibacter nanhaiticus TaxID=558155 RepID=A0A1M6H8F0_9FLAO|nr:type IX secretion system plug protein domain-containing protein [Arenibacter nanhaiticus]SHJ18409.1 protein of unknown function [Arenibacter nanhaiticus]